MWKFDPKQPIYLQIIEKIENKILSGEYKAGDKIESVRELASIAGVNPNTMQKALSEMENSGIIITQRTAGKFITDDINVLNSMREEKADIKIRLFLSDMNSSGYSIDDVIEMISKRKHSPKAISLEKFIEEEENEQTTGM